MLFLLKATTFWIGWLFLFSLLLLWFCFRLFQKKTQPTPDSYSMADLSEATIFDATIDDIVILTGYGEGFDDVHLTVKEHNAYRLENGFEWEEVICEYKGRELCIEAENNEGEVFISATSEGRKMDLDQIQTPAEQPLTEEVLARYLTEDDEENFVVLNGKRFYYNEGKECLYMPNRIEDDGEEFFYWDFEDKKEEEILSVEAWKDSPLVVFRGTILHADFVTLLKAR